MGSNGVSFLIPARNEKYLQNTIDNILQNIRGDSEIIVVLDGYVPDPPIVCTDSRVMFIKHETSIGQRAAINEAARASTKDFIFKADAHCAIDEGMDTKLMADCEYDWTVIPRMYNLDIETFKPKFNKRTDYMMVSWNDKNELRSLYYTGKDFRKWHDRSELIDDTMCNMGPGFFMHKKRFIETGMCDEGHIGGWSMQGIETSCKAWLSGGRLVVNKKTFFSHWFRGNIGFPYPMSGRTIDKARKYSMDLWLNNRWPQQTRKFSWLVEKFWPVPGWTEEDIAALKEQERTGEDYMTIRKRLIENKKQKEDKIKMKEKEKGLPNNAGVNIDELHRIFYKNVHLKGRDLRWKGLRMIKLPMDICLYHEAIWERKPDYMVEIGTAFSASAVFFADMLRLVGNGGKVISIDPSPRSPVVEDPDITYLTGDSKDPEIVKKVKEIIGDKSCMVSVDGDHSKHQVQWDLYRYRDVVTPGQFLVCEDCYDRNGAKYGPKLAQEWFLAKHKNFELLHPEAKYLIGFTRDSWLLRRK
jgi:cephalosporin hydroxylase